MYTIPKTYKDELLRYKDLLNLFLKEKTDPLDFKIVRVNKGIYEQRKKGTYMVRMRCSGGYISPTQLLGISEIAEEYNSEIIHITTRQELQLHNIELKDTYAILEKLRQIGVSSRGGGGNTVRNITSSIDTGISSCETFDVTQHNIALLNYLMRKDSSWDMPRKFKISFSNSDDDNGLAAFNDLGFVAKVKDNIKGFKVFIGGAPSNKPMVGIELFDFIEENEIFRVSDAVIALFSKYGNRKNRHKARLRFIFYKYGTKKVLELFNEIYKNTPSAHNEFDKYRINPKSITPDNESSEPNNNDNFIKWHQTYVTDQKQDELHSIQIPVHLGNLSNRKFNSLANFLKPYGDDVIRFSRRQNIHLRNIHKSKLGNIFNFLEALEIDFMPEGIIGDLVSCTGADTCQLGICFSKGGLQSIYNRLKDSELDFERIRDIKINISGCPNACGQHWVADLGFAGKVSRNEKIYPAYTVYGGVKHGIDSPQLPQKLGEISAKDLPLFTHAILRDYSLKKGYENFRDYILNETDDIEKILQQFQTIPSFNDDKNYYIDWGDDQTFSIDGRGLGECSVGFIDRIEVETKNIKKMQLALQANNGIDQQVAILSDLVVSSTRLALLTKQLMPKDEKKIIEEFDAHFLKTGIIDSSYRKLLDINSEGNFSSLIKNQELVINLSNDTMDHYSNLDENLEVSTPYVEISVNEFKQMIDNKEDVVIIDVRQDFESEITSLGGTTISLDDIVPRMDEIPKDKTVVMYCRTGRRSSEACAILAEEFGYTNLINVIGGIHAWSDEIDNSIPKY